MREYQAYDNNRPNIGRSICKKKASLMDGQHRLGGIGVYTKETSAMLNVPFLAFHCLDEDEEIKFFDIINTKAKGIGSSLSRYLKRNNDNLSWIATQLIINPDSPFYSIGTLIGKRNKDKHITLQNIHNFLKLLTRKSDLAELPKEKILYISLYYFNEIKNILPNQWSEYKKYRLTHIVCLNALSIAGNTIILENYNFSSNQLNNTKISKILTNIQNIDWSSEGSLKYLKGVSSSNFLAADLVTSFKK
ncbi:DGQHR domain-containing protein [Peribacillus simplex]|nr:DGQHR domain-containing protein [Peribacillus simplex]